MSSHRRANIARVRQELQGLTLAKVETFEKIDSKKATGTLIVMNEVGDTVAKSFANLPGVTLVTPNDLNPVNVLSFRHIVMVGPEAIVSILEAKIK